MGPAIRPIREDYLECFDLLNLDREDLQAPKSIFANEPPPLNADVYSKMKELGNLPATIVENYRAKAKLAREKEKTTSKIAKDMHLTIPDAMNVIVDSAGKSNGHRTQAFQTVLKDFGPVPEYVQSYLRHLIRLGDGKKALSYLKDNPNLSRYVSFRFVLEDLSLIHI